MDQAKKVNSFLHPLHNRKKSLGNAFMISIDNIKMKNIGIL